MMSSPGSEKKSYSYEGPAPDTERAIGGITDAHEEGEVFKKDGAVNFRTVGWLRATMIFLKG